MNWIAVDWGTTHLRAHLMGADSVVTEATSEDGMGTLARDAFEPTLLRLVGAWLNDHSQTRVLACGMVGSRQGWLEAPYRATPCAPLDSAGMVHVPTRDARIDVWLVPGLKQMQPADVMRGEETQIAGALALLPDFDGVICLPGTHSKWARVSAGEVVGFQTCMTGELFSLLSTQSVLRHGMEGDGWDDAAFASAVSDAIAQPEKIASRLFALRAEGLIAGLGADAARARLSGLLIGIELAATRAYWLGQNVALIGAPALSALYARALALQGVTARELPATACVLEGLASARMETAK